MHRSILIVEDDNDIRETLRLTFSMLGYKAAVAENGQVALDKLAAMDPPCMILLDLMMPIMSGQQFCDRRRNDPKLAQIPVVLLTADTHAEQKAEVLGACFGLSKPVDFALLRSVAQKFCEAA